MRNPIATRLAWAGAVQICAPGARSRRRGPPRGVVMAFALGLVLSWAWATAAWGGETALACLGCGGATSSIEQTNPLIELAASAQCVRIKSKGRRQHLINHCGVCRIVQVTRRRPDGKPPAIRVYTMKEKSRMSLPFRGPGQSRVLTDRPCEGADARTLENRKCVALHNTADKGDVLVNACGLCRKVELERIYDDGGRTRQTYTIGKRNYIKVPARGAKHAEVRKDEPCA